MRKLKYVQLFENFGKLNESLDWDWENWFIKPYEFKTPEDWEKEFKPYVDWSVKLNSTKQPPQNEVYQFESYVDNCIREKSSYGNKDTFENIIESLLVRSFEEMFKEKKPQNGTYFWQDNFFNEMAENSFNDDKDEYDWHNDEDNVNKVVEYFLMDFSSDSKFERDDDSALPDWAQSLGTYEGTVNFRAKGDKYKVFEWSSGGDGFDFYGSMYNEEILYAAIKDYLTMVLYM